MDAFFSVEHVSMGFIDVLVFLYVFYLISGFYFHFQTLLKTVPEITSTKEDR